MKMSDAFVLPVSRHMGDLFNSKNPISDTRFCKFFSMQQCKKSEYTAHAINSHDSLVDFIRKVAKEQDGTLLGNEAVKVLAGMGEL